MQNNHSQDAIALLKPILINALERYSDEPVDLALEHITQDLVETIPMWLVIKLPIQNLLPGYEPGFKN